MIDNATANAILARLAPELAAPKRRRLPLRVDAAIAGWLDEERAARLAAFADVFAVNSDSVDFVPALRDARLRSEAMAVVAEALAHEGALTAWRNELYAVAPEFGAPPWFRLERAAARYFGVHTWAAHANGVVRGSPEPQMWFARRSPDKAIDPGMLDNLVGGGIAAGATVAKTLVKEAWEEAGVPAELAALARPVGAVQLWRELPENFVPANQDGEAVGHRRVRIADAARLIAVVEGPDKVTADASLVVLDYLMRHGAIDSTSPVCDKLKALLHPQAAARRA